MKDARRLALSAERLTALSPDELRAVDGGASLVPACVDIRDPSDFFVSVCDGCLTRGCT